MEKLGRGLQPGNVSAVRHIRKRAKIFPQRNGGCAKMLKTLSSHKLPWQNALIINSHKGMRFSEFVIKLSVLSSFKMYIHNETPKNIYPLDYWSVLFDISYSPRRRNSTTTTPKLCFRDERRETSKTTFFNERLLLAIPKDGHKQTCARLNIIRIESTHPAKALNRFNSWLKSASSKIETIHLPIRGTFPRVHSIPLTTKTKTYGSVGAGQVLIRSGLMIWLRVLHVYASHQF